MGTRYCRMEAGLKWGVKNWSKLITPVRFLRLLASLAPESSTILNRNPLHFNPLTYRRKFGTPYASPLLRLGLGLAALGCCQYPVVIAPQER